ncbi:MAG: hypothetical protein QXH97_00345 [Candidatus Bathyarchaeia archaeon]
MSEAREYVPPFIYCPKCGGRVKLKALTDEEISNIRKEGYDDAKKGACRCGVVLVICHLPIPQSPSYSMFFDLYVPTKEYLTALEEIN